MMNHRSIAILSVVVCAAAQITSAFTATSSSSSSIVKSTPSSTTATFMSFSPDEFTQETPENTKQRIQELVDNNPVLVFMKGSKLLYVK
jgi:ABC-type phosphate transport system substrate-binding protein